MFPSSARMLLFVLLLETLGLVSYMEKKLNYHFKSGTSIEATTGSSGADFAVACQQPRKEASKQATNLPSCLSPSFNSVNGLLILRILAVCSLHALIRVYVRAAVRLRKITKMSTELERGLGRDSNTHSGGFFYFFAHGSASHDRK